MHGKINHIPGINRNTVLIILSICWSPITKIILDEIVWNVKDYCVASYTTLNL